MKSFGFLSFGHHSMPGQAGPSAAKVLNDTVELARASDEIGVNNASVRVHHFVPQAASPMPILGAMIGATKNIEVGTGVIDMRYENPLNLAEELAALDLLSGGRVALGVSRGSPEPSKRGWEAFGYSGEAENGADLARHHFERFMGALDGEAMAQADALEKQYPPMYRPGTQLPVFPHSPTARKRIFWGSGTNSTAEQAARDGVNLMSSTLVSEADGRTLGEVQAEQIERYRAEWKKAGHNWTPRVSVSRSIFPLVTDQDHRMFGPTASEEDQIGSLGEGRNVTFGRSYAAAPDELIDQLKADPAIAAADTLLLTIPIQMGAEVNISIMRNFAEHVAPALGWEPNDRGLPTGYPIQ